MSFRNTNFKSLIAIISKLKTYLNNDYLLNKNFNGKLLINFEKIHGSKYLDHMEISASFINGKIVSESPDDIVKQDSYNTDSLSEIKLDSLWKLKLQSANDQGQNHKTLFPKRQLDQ